ncbi:MEDS domain-containing protein [Actinoplanes sp. NBRC 103695]|uniref:MEDS domain-containing protein n=1 Tax=Actinoplanes sp. NBRC 103695 TaxID=3032202 RepID=UPI0024A47A6B|nr:MEDS domain-containing protein [Actinoplanes sp. NBRC 103695]GLY99438.1 hypothetical protein Acsp02_66910 [Actinoplanes sp. NBRC 103695]
MTHEHVCFSYDDDSDLYARAQSFLADGAAAGCQLWWIGDLPPPAGYVTTAVSISAAYPGNAVIDPEAQLRQYAKVTSAAVAAGFTGLRVVAQATPLVRTREQLDAFARYELLIDRYMATHPFSAICAYDRRELDSSAIDELACLHPDTNAPVPFHLHGCPPDGGAAALTGELDMTTDELFEVTLGRLSFPGDDEVVLDATGLRFADHRALWRMNRWAAEHDRHLVLRGAGRATARVVDLMDLPRLHVEAIA